MKDDRGLKSVRRIVTKDGPDGKSRALADGPVESVVSDPARPGYTSSRVWLTDRTPGSIADIRESLARLPHGLLPPKGGSLCRIVTIPPDGGKPAASDVQAFFAAVGAPGASTFSASAPHPYMQKTRTLDLCLVLEGEITLVLDTEEVQLSAGDTVVQRGTNHAWSNRSGKPCVIAISSHDGAERA
jgi:mannose-6-phosphate isomerase-like protein (cupin superfamily)